MGSETLTTWTCDRCGQEVTTTEADTEPLGWEHCEHADADGHWVDDILCDECQNQLLTFFSGNATRGHE